MDIPGYAIDGPIGFGTDGATWLARDEAGEAVAVRVLPAIPAERHRSRLERLRRLAGIDHPHLVGLREVVSTEDGATAVVTKAVPGPTLATLRVSRRGLDVAEALSVGTALAAALVALHGAGLTHGDLAPANVVLTPGHGAVLVDLAGEPAWESGTGGFAAPELDAGSVPTPAADTYALARLIVWLVGERDRTALQDLLASALRADPRQRCTAAELLEVLSAHPQATVGMPDLRTLAGVSLREHAQREMTRRKGAHRPRHRRNPRRLPRLIGAFMLVALLAATAAWVWPGVLRTEHSSPAPAVASESPADEIPAGSTRPGNSPDGADDDGTDDGAQVTGGVVTRAGGADGLVEAARSLTQQRDTALNTGDADALAALTVPGSPAAAQDEPLIADLEAGDLQVHGLHTEVTEPQMLGNHAIRAVLLTHEHTRSTPQESRTVFPERTCVILDLARGEQAWQVAEIRAC